MKNMKAYIGASVAFLGALATGLDDSALNAQEIITALIAGLVALGGVYAVTNAPTE